MATPCNNGSQCLKLDAKYYCVPTLVDGTPDWTNAIQSNCFDENPVTGGTGLTPPVTPPTTTTKKKWGVGTWVVVIATIGGVFAAWKYRAQIKTYFAKMGKK